MKTYRNMTCEARVEPHLKGRIADLTKLLKAERDGEDDEENGNLSEYGLCFDYVAPETFSDQSIRTLIPRYGIPLERRGRVMRPAACSAFHGLNQGRIPFSSSVTICPVILS